MIYNCSNAVSILWNYLARHIYIVCISGASAASAARIFVMSQVRREYSTLLRTVTGACIPIIKQIRLISMPSTIAAALCKGRITTSPCPCPRIVIKLLLAHLLLYCFDSMCLNEHSSSGVHQYSTPWFLTDFFTCLPFPQCVTSKDRHVLKDVVVWVFNLGTVLRTRFSKDLAH